jgi:hypothetical protein
MDTGSAEIDETGKKKTLIMVLKDFVTRDSTGM